MFVIIAEIGIIVLLVLLNGFFALSELAVLSSNKARLKVLARQGNKNAQTVINISNSPDLFLSTVQLWITLIGILSGLIGGVTLEAELNSVISQIPYINAYSDTISYILLVIGITYLAVIFGEIVPKRIALNNPERIALRTAGIFSFLIRILKPFVFILKASTILVLKIARLRQNDETPISEEEVKLLLEEGMQKGVFEEEEVEIVENALNLSDSVINEIMTHRLDFDYMEIDMTKEQILEKIKESRFSKFPVVKESLDDIPGFVNVRDILLQYASSGDIQIDKLLIKPNIVNERMPVYDVLEIFKNSGIHFGLVVNEHKLIEGLITLSDIMESVVGQMSMDSIPKLRQREDGTFLIDGLVDIDTVKQQLGLGTLPYDDDMFHTLGGFIITHLGIVPGEGESFIWNKWKFEIIDMDGNRIDKVLVSKTENK